MIDSNTIALVSGANRGLGRALVDALLTRGVTKVYATVRDPANAAGLGDDARVVPLEMDVTRAERVAAAAREADDVTLVFNNAGVLDVGDILDTPIELVRRDLETNYIGALQVARAFAPALERNGKSGSGDETGGTAVLVNTLTLVALASMPTLAVYNASKAAAWSMTQSLRATLGPRGVRVVGVFPGAVDTDMLASVEMDKASPAAVADAILDGVVAGQDDVFPDAMAQSVYADWRSDHKAVERRFAVM